jgi:hypothetical protein
MMSVKIQLKNNWWYEATVVEGGLYEVQLAKGVKIYSLDNIKAVNIDGEDARRTSDAQEDIMTTNNNLAHFLREHTMIIDGITHKYVVRVLTNEIPARDLDNYKLSVTTRKPVNNIYALNTGAYHFTLIENKLVNSGKMFTLSVFTNKDMALLGDTKIKEYLDRATFAFANASYTTFLRVSGSVNFGLEDLGLMIDFSKKTAKRLMEVTRLTAMSLVSDHFNIDFSEDFDGEDILVDGKSYVSRNFVARMARNITHEGFRNETLRRIRSGELVHVELRAVTEYGLIKGNAIVVPDSQINGKDIRTHSSNLKTELASDGYQIATCWEHRVSHLAVWDQQSAINFRCALTEAAQMRDIKRLVDNTREVIAKGELPEWLLLGEDAHNDDGTPDMEKLSDTINRAWTRWQAHGFDVRAAQNLVYMALGGIIKRMDGEKIGGFHKKMWIPMSNAALVSVITHESITELGGFDVRTNDNSTCFFDRRVGFVMPGVRFAETYNLHGGWDLDDSMKIIHVKVWTSNVDVLDAHRGMTLPMDSDIPTTAEEARDMIFCVRSPNGPGEYSIEEMDFSTFPYIDGLRDLDNITVINMANMPLPQPHLQVNTVFSGVPTSQVYSNTAMTRDDAFAMISAQTRNPGVGRFVNALMIWADCQGPSFPAKMLGKMEDMVDAVQQGFDKAAFEAIEAEPAHIFEQLPAGRVDAALAATRLPRKYAEKMTVVAGRWTRVQRAYDTAIQSMRDELQMHSLQMRQATTLVHNVQRFVVGNQIKNWAEHFYNVYNARLAMADREFTVTREDNANAFRKMDVQNQHKLAMEAIVADMIRDFDMMEEDERYMFVIGLYKFITRPTINKPYGMLDRIIFQPGATGARSVMDILIEALQHNGF